MIDNKNFFCVEQYYQLRKALHHEKPDIAQKIQVSTSQKECKNLGDSIKSNKEWTAIAQNVMTKACLAKFSQNERSRTFLQNTGNTTIAEASTDLFWGTGLRLSNPEIGLKHKWTGQNHLGEILMGIRDKLLKN